jgi:Uma2 family endonuclease
MMSAVKPHVLKAEDFWHVPETRMRRALVRGEVMEALPPGGRQGVMASELTTRLRLWAKSGPGGCVGVESGFMLTRDPDTVRGPEVLYVRAERMPHPGIPESYWEQPPDLAVEIVSPNASANAVHEQVRDYRAAGTSLVWVISPRTQKVVVHTPDGLARTYSRQDTLTHETILPEFTCVIAELFA